MLHDQGLPLHLWTKACNTIIYLQNESPHQILGMITLEEVFSRRNLYVSHFKNFETYVYCHVSKYSRKNLVLTAELGVFVCYNENPHNYHVYLPSLRMKIVRRDVKFDEEK